MLFQDKDLTVLPPEERITVQVYNYFFWFMVASELYGGHHKSETTESRNSFKLVLKQL